MYLIEYSEGSFVNAENIDWLQIKDSGELVFETASDPTPFTVDIDMHERFLNQLQALNSNICNVEHRYSEQRRGSALYDII